MLVTYENCECLGYLDSEGKWRNWFSNKELHGVSEWIRLYQRCRLVA